MRKVNRKSRFPARPWITEYTKAFQPKLKARALKAIAALDKAGVFADFVDYLKREYPHYDKTETGKEFIPDADARELDKLCQDTLSAIGWDADKLAADLTGRLFEASSKHAFGKLGLELKWNIKSPAVEKAIKQRQNFIKDVGKSQFKELKDLIRTQCYELGGSPVSPSFLSQVREAAGKQTQYQAERIARTETCDVSSKASVTVFKGNGVDQKEWIHSGSEYERHKPLDGEIVGIDEAFSNGQQHPGDDTGDPADSIKCLCAVAPVMSSGFSLDPDEAVTE